MPVPAPLPLPARSNGRLPAPPRERAPFFAALLTALVATASPALAQESAPDPAPDIAPVTTPDTAPDTVPAATSTPPSTPPRIETGFTPDPLIIRGRTGGQRPFSEFGEGCSGYGGTAPGGVLQLEGGFGFLRVFVVAPQRVTLAVRGPDGRWHCGGDTLGGAPREEASFGAGRLEIWVGGATAGADVPYAIHVTEFSTVGPGSAQHGAVEVGGADIGLSVEEEAGRFCRRRVRRGFLPDPQEDAGTAGGPIDTRLLGARCRGFVSAQPSHMLTLRDQFDYLRVQVAGARGRASLIVRDPNGRFFCSRADEADARVDSDSWSPGVYRIWVGSVEADEEPNYSICYTEVRAHEGRIICGEARAAAVSRLAREDGCSRELHRCDRTGAEDDERCRCNRPGSGDDPECAD